MRIAIVKQDPVPNDPIKSGSSPVQCYFQPLTAVGNTIMSVYLIVCNGSVYTENVVTDSQIKCKTIKPLGAHWGTEKICLLLPNYQ